MDPEAQISKDHKCDEYHGSPGGLRRDEKRRDCVHLVLSLREECPGDQTQSQDQESCSLDGQERVVQKIQVRNAHGIDQLPGGLVYACHQHHDDAGGYKSKGSLGKLVIEIPHEHHACDTEHDNGYVINYGKTYCHVFFLSQNLTIWRTS